MAETFLVGGASVTVSLVAHPSLVGQVPYAFSLYGVAVTGVLYINDPIDDSYTEGVVAGAVTGGYKLTRGAFETVLYDPTGRVVRFNVQLDYGATRMLRASVCTGNLSGGWDCPPWTDILSW
jgi:hypothetical protein